MLSLIQLVIVRLQFKSKNNNLLKVMRKTIHYYVKCTNITWQSMYYNTELISISCISIVELE